MELRWTNGVADVRCAVCGRSEAQELLATTVVAWRDDPLEIARCGDCGSIALSAVLPPSAYSDADWDWYVEHVAGVEAIAKILAKAGAPAGSRMLDVGCGFGFGVDLGQEIFGWEAIGLEPSVASGLGREALGVDLRSEILDESWEPDLRFDVVFASEVLEHVPDPTAFVKLVADRLTDRGVFVMTTPDAGCIRPETPMTALYPALSVGLHAFLLTREGLERLLQEAGLVAHVWVEGVTLGAVAARSRAALSASRPDANVTLRQLIDYCERRWSRSTPGSAIAVGMATRRMKFAVIGNEFASAEAAYPPLRDAVQDRFGIDLDDPSTTLTSTDRRSVLVVAHYYVGVLLLVHRRDARLAARHFEAAAAVAKAEYEREGLYIDPETPVLEVIAHGHQALAVAEFAPAAVPAVLEKMDEAVRRGAGTVEIAAEFRARAERVVAFRKSLRGKIRLRGRASAARVYRRLTRARVPGLANAARLVRSVLVRKPATPGRPSSGRPTST